jgi:hypothetical protein
MTKSYIYINDLIMATLATLAAMGLIFCLTFFYGANTEELSKPKNQAVDKIFTMDYRAAKNRCEALLGSEKTVCDTNAEMAKDDLKADLDSSFESSVQKRNLDKYGEFYQDKTLTFEGFDYKNNLVTPVEFEDVYHVKA